MATDIFSRTVGNIGAFTADSVTLTWPQDVGGASTTLIGTTKYDFGTNPLGLLTQQLSVNYQQPIQTLFDIGTANRAFVAGRPEGRASLERVVGPSAAAADFYNKFGDVCRVSCNTINFSFTQGCNTCDGETSGGVSGFQDTYLTNGNKISRMMIGAVITSVGLSVQAERVVLNEQIQLMFAFLKDEEHQK